MQTSRIAPRALAISALWILAGCDFGVDEGHFNALDADAEVTAETQFVNEGSLNPYPIIERASGWVVKVFTTDFGGRMDRVQYIPCSEDTPEACQKAIDAYDSQSQSGKAERVYVEQSTC